MNYPLRAERPVSPRSPAKIQLILRTPDVGSWSVTLSDGIERFIGHYPRVPGLGSDGPLLEYRPVACP
jgi:hypothetical protein